MIRKLYDLVLTLAASPRAPGWLSVVSFAESSVFPVPPDAMLVPMCLARPDKAYAYAAWCTVASVLGGLLGYAIGAVFFQEIAFPVLAAYGYGDALSRFQSWFEAYGAAVILVKGLTPIPYKVVTIASGAASFSLPIFILASFVTRGARFFLLACLLRRYGEAIRAFVERRLTLIAAAFGVAIVAGFALLKLI